MVVFHGSFFLCAGRNVNFWLDSYYSQVLLAITKMSFYAVARGRNVGIFSTWSECESQVKGFSGAKFKKFQTQQQANEFIGQNNTSARTAVTNYANKERSVNVQPQVSRNTNKPPESSVFKRKEPYKFVPKIDNRNFGPSKSGNISDKSKLNIVGEEYRRILDDGVDIQDLIMSQMDRIESELKVAQKRVSRIQNGGSPNTPQARKQTIMLTKALPKTKTKRMKSKSESEEESSPERVSPSKITKRSESATKRNKTSLTTRVTSYKSIRSDIERPVSIVTRAQHQLSVDDDDYVHVFTDGACSNNGTKAARAGLGVYFGEEHPLNMSCPVSGRATNNCGEIQAATQAIRQVRKLGIDKLCINTDSNFLIDSATKWIPSWKRNSWKKMTGQPVKNEIDFRELDSEMQNMQIRWRYVKAHEGIEGNERADELAKRGAAMYKCTF